MEAASPTDKIELLLNKYKVIIWTIVVQFCYNLANLLGALQFI